MMEDREFDEWIQENYPDLREWGEPLAVQRLGEPEPHYACPLCVARFGLRASSITGLPTRAEEIRDHIRERHVILKESAA